MHDWKTKQQRQFLFPGRSHLEGSGTRSRRLIPAALISFLIALALPLLGSTLTLSQSAPTPVSNSVSNSISAKEAAPFNQLSFYPLQQTLPADLYRPTGEWMGRLVLPRVEQFQQWQQANQETDWAWFEVYHAPVANQALVGKIVRLGWSNTPKTQRYVKQATRDVRFTPEVQKSIDAGRMHPVRLNGRNQVGPLQSLAGFRPQDDVTVVLKGDIQIAGNATTPATAPALNAPTLRINREPVMETGRFVALVQIQNAIAPPTGYSLPAQCPGEMPCASEFFRVRHYNPATKQFDGLDAIIRVPQQPPDAIGVFFSTPRDLEKSPVGKAGWYVYGAQDKNGIFTAQALKPRSLFQLQPSQVILGEAKALKYIRYQNWADTPERKGTAQSVLVQEQETQPEAAIAQWTAGFNDKTPIGTRALVMHLFGARGGAGKLAELGPLGTYTGHFAYGLGEVVRDPFTQEPQFDITYVQIYANNGPGIMSGANTWANYMGNLYRGKMGTHPVSDIFVKLEALTQDYQLGGIRFSPFKELLTELSLVAARYRIGDGSGSALISAATSCVQDSNQALYNALRRFQQGIENTPSAAAWVRANPNAPDAQRYQRLLRLSQDLYRELTPLGVVRWDWDNNADVILGTQPGGNFISLSQLTVRNVLTGLLSWRTALPRQGQDEIAILYLKNGASLWFLRPNQLGGHDASIYPIAPTLAMGAYTLPFTNIPIVSILLTRIFASLRIPFLSEWLWAGFGLVIFGAVAYWLGTRSGFLRWQSWSAPWPHKLLLAIKLFFAPALAEEFIFRVLLIPEPGRTGVTEPIWWFFALVSLGVYVAYHLLNGKFFYKSAKPTFFHPTFLILCTLLGVTCTLVYRVTSSLWPITLIHWLAVLVWILFLGGWHRLGSGKQARSQVWKQQPLEPDVSGE